MVVPLYLSELAPPNIRGGLVALQQLGITIGIMVAFWLNYGTVHIGGTGEGQSPAAWRLPLALQVGPAIVLALGTFVMPYSPRWLAMHDRLEEAAETLSRIRRVTVSDWRFQRELGEIQAATIFDRESLETRFPDLMGSPFKLAVAQYAELFTVTHLRKRLAIACLLQVIQQFTGINAIIYYYLRPHHLRADRSIRQLGQPSSDGRGGHHRLLLDDSGHHVPRPLGSADSPHGWRRGHVASRSSSSQPCMRSAGVPARSENTGAAWATAAFIWLYISSFAFGIGCVNWITPSEMFPPARIDI